MDAHKKLHALAPYSINRKYFGLSRPENGVIVYKAAAEEIYPGEAETINADTLVVKKGKYICVTVNDFMHDIPVIKKTFEKLLFNPQIDPQGYCVEWYFNEMDVKCMVRLKD